MNLKVFKIVFGCNIGERFSQGIVFLKFNEDKFDYYAASQYILTTMGVFPVITHWEETTQEIADQSSRWFNEANVNIQADEQKSSLRLVKNEEEKEKQNEPI